VDEPEGESSHRREASMGTAIRKLNISIQKIFIWKFFKFSSVSNREDCCLSKFLPQSHRPVARKLCINYREMYLIILPIIHPDFYRQFQES